MVERLKSASRPPCDRVDGALRWQQLTGWCATKIRNPSPGCPMAMIGFATVGIIAHMIIDQKSEADRISMGIRSKYMSKAKRVTM